MPITKPILTKKPRNATALNTNPIAYSAWTNTFNWLHITLSLFSFKNKKITNLHWNNFYNVLGVIMFFSFSASLLSWLLVLSVSFSPFFLWLFWQDWICWELPVVYPRHSPSRSMWSPLPHRPQALWGSSGPSSWAGTKSAVFCCPCPSPPSSLSSASSLMWTRSWTWIFSF